MAMTDEENERSGRVLLRLGFKEVKREPYKNVELGDRILVEYSIDRSLVEAWEGGK